MNQAADKPDEMVEIDIDLIDIPKDRLRLVNPARVDELLHSFLEVGQLQPIAVRPADVNGRSQLIWGAHRTVTGLKAEFATMKAIVRDGSADELRVLEIDENLYRYELTPLDQAASLAERRVLFERTHGPIRPGRPAVSGNSAKLAKLSFFEETSQKFGLPLRTIERALERRRKIVSDAWQQLRELQIPITGAELDALASQHEEVQRDIVARLLDPTTKANTVNAALKSVLGSKQKLSKSLFDQFLDIWGDMDGEEKGRVRAYVAPKNQKGTV